MEDFLTQSLNPSQLEAVTYCEGPSLVIAGAGSGKTRVLTYKIAYLMEKGLAPWNILALTFTNKASREMNERISAIVGPERTRGLWSGTFHSVFSKILRTEASFLGYTADFTIYDASDSRSLIKSIIKEMTLDDKVYKPATIAGRISEAKNHLLLPEDYAADPNIQKRDSVDNIGKTYEIYKRYWVRCRQSNAMDFDDLLLNTYLLFNKNEDIRRKYEERFLYILVDEYQDTNMAQHRIIAQLTRPDSKICVVGDDAQSIYGFRGANIDNILRFTQQYPTAKMIKLEQNYRSTQTIVNAANSIIRHNRNQIAKKVFSTNEVGKRIQVISSYSDKEESLKVAGEIKRVHKQLNIDYSEIALLYRTNSQSRAFEESFRNTNIPYRIYGGLSFYQRKEIKDVIAYFRLINNLNDEEAFKRIINYPARGIGATTQSKILVAAGEYGVSLWNVLDNPVKYGIDFNKGTLAKLNGFKDFILRIKDKLLSTTGYALAAEIIRESGIGAEIHADRSPENLSKQENVEELLNAIKAYETEVLEETGREIVPLTEYLSQVSLLTDADQEEDGTPKVTLMTVHAAKGLEFETVFVTGMEDELFPNANAHLYPKEMEEERRLFYVAITRAKKYCYLTYAKSRFKYGNIEFSNPSPFLDEIDPQYLDRDDTVLNSSRTIKRPSTISAYNNNCNSVFNNGNNSLTKNTNTQSIRHFTPIRNTITSPCSQRSSILQNGNLSVGQKIEHERFGIGIIIQIEGTGDNMKACVDFENAGKKNLLLKFAKFKTIQ